ncbi:MAG: hypothetical protein K0R61_4304 [Microvirga sp.]|nr:hypothetical protein [Microvirga sp.]
MPGQLWKVEIPKAIRQAGIFLACLSSRSVEKVGFVQNEFRLALSAFGERPPESIWLIPVRLDDCAVPDLRIPDLGLSLQDIQWVDLWQEGEFDRLVKSIEQTLRGGTPPPEAVRKEAASTSSPSEPVKLIEPNDKTVFCLSRSIRPHWLTTQSGSTLDCRSIRKFRTYYSEISLIVVL